MSQNTDALETMLSQLNRWRHLPKYRLESHVDVLFGLTLPTVIKSKFETDGELHVIPEFPIHHKTARIDRKNNQSSNVDFAVFSEGGKDVFLVELKTDPNSVSLRQLERMRQAKAVRPFSKLVAATLTIARITNQKAKYGHLIWQLHEAGAMSVPPELKDLEFCERLNGFARILENCNPTATLADSPTLVLVQPEHDTVADFHCVGFREYADLIRGDGPLATTLARYLPIWEDQTAGRIAPWQTDGPGTDSQ